MRLVRTLALTLLLAAGAALVWLAASTAWAARRESRALAGWGPGGLEAAVAAIPKKETNAAAKGLEESAKALGIDLAPRGGSVPVEDAVGFDREDKSEWGKVRGPLVAWVTAESERPEAVVAPAPGPVVAFLTKHAGGIDAIESALVSGPAPEWAEDPSLLFAAPSPRLAGHMQLHALLLARALQRAAAGDAAGADRAVLASWNLAAPERRRVDIPSRGIALLATHLEIGVLGKFPADPEWRTRLAALDPRAWVKAGWRFEAWRVWTAGRRLRDDAPSDAPGGFVARLASRPRERLAGAALLDGWRAMSDAADLTPVSDGDVKALAEAFEKGAGRWAAPPTSAILAAAASIRRADRLALEAELAGKVLDARAARGASGAWPASLPGVEASKAANVKWTYAVTAEGRASIATTRLLTWPDRASSILGWVSEPPAGKKPPAPKKK